MSIGRNPQNGIGTYLFRLQESDSVFHLKIKRTRHNQHGGLPQKTVTSAPFLVMS